MNMMIQYPIHQRLMNDFDRLVDQAFSSDGASDAGPSISSVEDRSEHESGWKLRLALPGYRKDEIKITADEEFLHLVAETEDEQRSFLAKAERRIKISEEVDVSGIKARLEDGILFLEIPRRLKEEPVPIVID